MDGSQTLQFVSDLKKADHKESQTELSAFCIYNQPIFSTESASLIMFVLTAYCRILSLTPAYKTWTPIFLSNILMRNTLQSLTKFWVQSRGATFLI